MKHQYHSDSDFPPDVHILTSGNLGRLNKQNSKQNTKYGMIVKRDQVMRSAGM